VVWLPDEGVRLFGHFEVSVVASGGGVRPPQANSELQGEMLYVYDVYQAGTKVNSQYLVERRRLAYTNLEERFTQYGVTGGREALFNVRRPPRLIHVGALSCH